ncbi:MAG: thiamine pyrophosphate-dependent dehydrogenase E1 component subunit alpha [Casimicrobiaceae bacterium]
MTLEPDRTPLAALGAMLLIRRFEAALARRPDAGFQLYSAGEEAVAVGVAHGLTASDRLLCSGRSIGPALAWGVEPRFLMAELLGRIDGPCGGKGGRGHVADTARGFMGAHAVVAGNIGIAAGVALASQQTAPGTVVACIFGDGACGAGVLHETMNIAALWKLPLILVCDNNQWSVTTARSAALAPAALADLARPFGIPAASVDGMDVLAVRTAVAQAAERARGGEGPSFVECSAERFGSHSTATRDPRGTAELAAIRERCPIERLARHLERDGSLDARRLDNLEAEIDTLIDAALRFAEASPWPASDQVLTDVG